MQEKVESCLYLRDELTVSTGTICLMVRAAYFELHAA